MDDSRKNLLLILCLLAGVLICAACTQKEGPSPFTQPGQSPGVTVSPGQPGPAATMGTCLPPQVWCNGRCADLSAERENCGACGALCPEGKICRNTQCISGDAENPGSPVIPGGTGNPGSPGTGGTTPAVTGTTGTTSCSSGQTNCYGSCVDLQSDTTHCGSCNTKCPSGKVCSAGTCSVSCSAGLDNCGGSCTNTQTSAQHCGKCNSPCPSGQSCQKGKCGLYASVMTLDAKQMCTSSGKLWCSGACVAQDTFNCGSCGNKCSSGQSCQNGKCGLYASVMTLDPKQMCTSSGKSWCIGSCADLKTDASNCGSCGVKCSSGETCSQGKCLSWTGTWKQSSQDPWSITLTQTGTSVTGFFGVPAHKTSFTGTTTGNPPVAHGSYNEVKQGSLIDTGMFEFTMTADGKQFSYWIKESTGAIITANYYRQ